MRTSPGLLVAMLLLAPVCALAQDEPDPYFVDANADGIDGVLADAIFVAPGGVDSPGGGTTSSTPVATINHAIFRATQTGRHQVLIQVGNYDEEVFLVGGVSLYGGYNASWQRVASTASVASTLTSSTGSAIYADGVASPTTVSFLTLRPATPGGFGESTYGARVYNSSGPVIFRYNRFVPGDGAHGVNGDDGLDASTTMTPAAPGQTAISGTGPARQGGVGGVSGCGLPGGRGGNGGIATGAAAQSGEPGSGGVGGGTPGANSSSALNSGGTGGEGGDGTDGPNGQPGDIAATVVGTLTLSTNYVPPVGAGGHAGIDGTSGAGGGGGGGQDCSMGCMPDRGAGGGGGGAGGCAGNGAESGRGGGGSFGVVIDNFSSATVTSNYFAPGKAGDGGEGGYGGDGANGGVGAPGGIVTGGDGGPGGPGGDGGDGGDGGSGAGGHGGPSFGIFDPQNRIAGTGNRYQQAAVASPGPNGPNNGATPSAGTRAFKHPDNAAVLGDAMFSIPAAVPATEPPSGSANLVVTVTLTQLSEEVEQVDFTLTPDSATEGSDYVDVSGSLFFNPWTNTAQITVPILADAVAEGPERFFITLTGVTGLISGLGVATVTIEVDAVFANGFE